MSDLHPDHCRDVHPSPIIASRPITATVRVTPAFHLDTQAARVEFAAAKLRDAVLAQLKDALPGITPDDIAQLLKFTEHETQVTTHPDGSVSMTVSYNVDARPGRFRAGGHPTAQEAP